MSVFLVIAILFSCSESNEVPSNEYRTGLFTQTVSNDGTTREYLIYIPTSYDGSERFPLMLNFHGYGMTAEDQLDIADMRSLADNEGFVLVYPQGNIIDGDPYGYHWNAGLDTESNKSSSDDLGFIEQTI